MSKTFALHSAPYPIRLDEFEGGTGPLIPWIKRRRNWDEAEWTLISQEDRQAAFNMLPANLQALAQIKPNPLIDVVKYNTFEPESYTHFIGQLGSLDTSYYKTQAVDPLQEMSADVVTFSKHQKGISVYETAEEGRMPWNAIQERTAIAIRRLRDYRDKGIFIYLTGSEMIDKDYVTDPRSKQRGDLPEQPYSVKGTVNLIGKMAGVVPHAMDIMCHARMLNNEAKFVCKSQPLTGGAACWEAKDRFGRLDVYMPPNIKAFFIKLYGEEITKMIYKSV